MLKIAVFGFFQPESGATQPGYRSPISGDEFMRTVWAMEPPASRVGKLNADEAPCFVKLTTLNTQQPVYVQLIGEQLAAGAGLLNCDGYVLLLDAVKILAPHTIRNALRRLYAIAPNADMIVAAGRQNEPDALSADDIRAVLGLSPALPIYPYVPDAPKTVHRLIRRIARYVDDPQRLAPPIFEGDLPLTALPEAPTRAPAPPPEPPTPRIHGLHHVAITVSDLQRALDFYRGILGFRVLGTLDFKNDTGQTLTHLDTGQGILELFSYKHANTTPTGWTSDNRQLGPRHFALRVTGLDAIAEQLACAGVEFVVEPQTSAVAGVRLAFFTDPDGTLIELVEGEMQYSR